MATCCPNADEYIPRGQTGYNGYDAVADKGTTLMIRAGTGNKVGAIVLLLVVDAWRHGRRLVPREHRRLPDATSRTWTSR